ncbi:SH3 domain-containing protein [Azospirillum sp. sgz301742]
MRRSATLLGLVLAAAPVGALAQAQTQPDRLTPRPPPTAVLPKATPVHTEPKGNAPAGLAVLLPLPVAPVPLSPVSVPGEPPAAAPPAAVASPAVASPAVPPAAVPPIVVPPPAKPKPAVAEAPKPVPAPEKKASEKKAGPRTVYAKDDVYIRATPGLGGKVLDALEPGAAVELVPGEAEDGWVRVARNGKALGWVSSKFLLDRAPGGRSADGCALPPDFPSRRGAPIAEGSAARALADANIRKSPACNATVLDVLEEGETVTVTAVSGTWYRVARRGRTLGYVSATLLGEAARGR